MRAGPALVFALALMAGPGALAQDEGPTDGDLLDAFLDAKSEDRAAVAAKQRRDAIAFGTRGPGQSEAAVPDALSTELEKQANKVETLVHTDDAYLDALRDLRDARAAIPAGSSGYGLGDRILRGFAMLNAPAVVALSGGASERDLPYTCTGTLIRNNVVLTAAHCGCPRHAGPPTYAIITSRLSGTSLLNAPPFETAPDGFFPVPRFDGASDPAQGHCSRAAADHADIALIRLKSRVPRDMAVPAQLVRTRASRGLVVGFGITEPEALFGSGDLYSSTPVGGQMTIPYPECDGVAGDGVTTLADAFACTPGREGLAFGVPHIRNSEAPGTCFGDSGGPFLSGSIPDSPGQQVTVSAVIVAGLGGKFRRDSHAEFTSHMHRASIACGIGTTLARLDEGGTLTWANACADALVSPNFQRGIPEVCAKMP